jgi:hypothetical protein
MLTLILFQGLFVFVHIFVFKNTLKNLLKWTLQLPFLVHPNVLSPGGEPNKIKDLEFAIRQW